ncbi:MAG TPA: hypothetical protein VGC54_14515 [Planctomycetota bacterium]
MHRRARTFAAGRAGFRARRARSAAPLVLGALGLLGGTACGDDAPAAIESGAARARSGALLVVPGILQFEPIPFGGRGAGSFELQNTGAAPLTLTRIGPLSCGCETAELELPARAAPGDRVAIDPDGMYLVLAPGERALLHMRVDTSRFREPISRRIGSFAVHHDGGDALLLEYAVDIFTPFQLEPWSLDLGEIGPHDRASGAVTLLAHDVDSFGLDLPAQVDGWDIAKERIEVGTTFAWRIHVTAPPELPYGPFQREFRFRTDLPDAPPVRFWVMGRVEPDLGWAPKRLLLHGEPGPVSASLRVQLRPAGERMAAPRLEFDAGEVAPAAVAADLETLVEGRQWRVVLTRTGPAPAAIVNGTLRLRTEHPEQEWIEVPYTLFPAPAAAADGQGR